MRLGRSIESLKAEANVGAGTGTGGVLLPAFVHKPISNAWTDTGITTFISYARPDGPFALRLATDLRAAAVEGSAGVEKEAICFGVYQYMTLLDL